MLESIESAKPDWFLSPVAEHVPDVTLMYMQALVETGAIPKMIAKGKLFVESVVSKSVVEGITEYDGKQGLLMRGALTESARGAISQIAYIVASHVPSDDKAHLQYLLVSVYLNQIQLAAWESLLTGWVLTDAEKLRILSSTMWDDYCLPDMLAFVTGWMRGRSEDSEEPSERMEEIAVIPNVTEIRQKFTELFLLGKVGELSAFTRIVRKSSAPAEPAVAPLLAVALYMQRDSVSLFELATNLLNKHSGDSNGFFIAGLYYLSVGRLDVARKFMSKSTLVRPTPQGWIGYGVAFALSDESGHAINAFRTAARLYPKCVLPWLYMGIEYIRTNELKLAQSYLVTALGLAGDDNPANQRLYRSLILNEIGVICLKAEQFDIATENLSICTNEMSESVAKPHRSIFFTNLGYALMKLRDVEGAQRAFFHAVSLNRSNGNALAGLGYCHHCKGSLNRAIETYTSSLSLISGNRKMENLVNNLIQLAINEYAFSVKYDYASTESAASADYPDNDEMVLSAY